MSNRRKMKSETILVSTVRKRVRFSEVDSMKVVWHGEYVRYFEDGREDFGRAYPGLGYMDIFDSGYTAPVVDVHLEYLRSLTVGDDIVIETRYQNVPGAKICFEYEIHREKDHQTVARGSSMQVFLDENEEMCLNCPEFYEEWKRKWIK